MKQASKFVLVVVALVVLGGVTLLAAPPVPEEDRRYEPTGTYCGPGVPCARCVDYGYTPPRVGGATCVDEEELWGPC